MASILSQPVVMVTGLQGHGKTLFALSMLRREVDKERENAAKENRLARPVFYSGIRDLALDWEEFGKPSLDSRKPYMTDPSEWYRLPEGAIIVIDEAQRLFRNRSSGSKAEPWVTALETLRHSGQTLVLITQHPNLLDPNVRMLTGMHFHCIRRFGMQRSMVHMWEGVKTAPQGRVARTESTKIPFKFDRRTYAVYKSAELHTIRRSIPIYWYLMFIVPVFIALGLWYVYGRFDARLHPVLPGGAPGSAVGVGTGGGAALPFVPVSYADGRRPSIDGLPFTAPVYSEAVRPKRVPYPAACLASKAKGCRCYTQDATAMDVPRATCESIVANGFFVDWDERRRGGEVREGVRERGGAEPASRVVSITPVVASPPVLPFGGAVGGSVVGSGKALPKAGGL